MPDLKDIPKALFLCSNRGCAEEVSYSPEELYWYEKESRWICDNCWYELPFESDDSEPVKGISLKQFIEQKKPFLTSLV